MRVTHCPLSVQVGDGTTSVTLLAAEFLKQVKPYVEEGLHPQIIIRAFRTATQLVRHGGNSSVPPHRDRDTAREMPMGMGMGSALPSPAASLHLCHAAASFGDFPKEEGINGKTHSPFSCSLLFLSKPCVSWSLLVPLR